MIVCHCRAVSCREIRRTVREGARTAREVGRACGATRGCGGCRPVVEALVRDELRALEAARLEEGLEAAAAR